MKKLKQLRFEEQHFAQVFDLMIEQAVATNELGSDQLSKTRFLRRPDVTEIFDTLTARRRAITQFDPQGELKLGDTAPTSQGVSCSICTKFFPVGPATCRYCFSSNVQTSRPRVEGGVL